MHSPLQEQIVQVEDRLRNRDAQFGCCCSKRALAHTLDRERCCLRKSACSAARGASFRTSAQVDFLSDNNIGHSMFYVAYD